MQYVASPALHEENRIQEQSVEVKSSQTAKIVQSPSLPPFLEFSGIHGYSFGVCNISELEHLSHPFSVSEVRVDVSHGFHPPEEGMLSRTAHLHRMYSPCSARPRF